MYKMFHERPSRPDNIFVGVFELVMGLFLMLPFASFAPTLKYDTLTNTQADPLYAYLTEEMFGIAMIVLGVVQIFLAATKRWTQLRHWVFPTSVFWTFVTIGYAITLPKGTAMVTFSVFTLWVVYQFLELSYWAGREDSCDNLRDKKNIGII